jgi:hypothetical protein
MPQPRKCPACGAELPSGSTECVHCLLGLGLGGTRQSELKLVSDFSSPPTVPLTSVRAEQPGDKIGRYELLQQIGKGGCGVVYMAQQEEPVRRRVALKVIKPGMDTKQVIARFEA